MNEAITTKTNPSANKTSCGLLTTLGQIAQEKALGVALFGAGVTLYARSQGMVVGNLDTLLVGSVVVNFVIYALCLFPSRHFGCCRRSALRGERAWSDRSILIRYITAPIGLGACVVLAIWTYVNYQQGKMPGDVGTVLVLILVTAMAAKLATEMYLLSWTGVITTDDSGASHQRSAKMLIEEYSRWTTLRYLLGALGGIILPLGTQILASGAKNIPSASIPGPSLTLACAAVVCLVPGEIIARWLFYRVTKPVNSTEV